MMLLPHTVRASTHFILTDTAASRALLMCIRISAARIMPMRFTTISRTSTGVLSFTPCVSLRCASRLRRKFCSAIIPAAVCRYPRRNRTIHIIVQHSLFCQFPLILQPSGIRQNCRAEWPVSQSSEAHTESRFMRDNQGRGFFVTPDMTDLYRLMGVRRILCLSLTFFHADRYQCSR